METHSAYILNLVIL